MDKTTRYKQETEAKLRNLAWETQLLREDYQKASERYATKLEKLIAEQNRINAQLLALSTEDGPR